MKYKQKNWARYKYWAGHLLQVTGYSESMIEKQWSISHLKLNCEGETDPTVLSIVEISFNWNNKFW